jgi:hypothetical protein
VLRLCHAIEMARPFAQADLSRLSDVPVASPVPRGIASMDEALAEVAVA